MVADFYQVPVPLQSELYRRIKERNVEGNDWYSDPGALNSVMDEIGQPQTQLLSTASVNDILSFIGWGISVQNHPIAILVRGGAHWIVAKSFTVEANDVIGFFVLDPWPDAPDQTFLPADVFADEYLTPIMYGQIWLNKLVAIGPAGNAWQAQQISIKAQIMAVPMGGGGLPNAAQAISALEKMGFVGIAQPHGGGAAVTSTQVRDRASGAIYNVLVLDATDEPSFGGLITVAQAANGRILEVTNNGDGALFLSDPDARSAARRLFPNASLIVLGAELQWTPSTNSRSRTSPLRLVHIDGRAVLLNRRGEVVEENATPARGS